MGIIEWFKRHFGEKSNSDTHSVSSAESQADAFTSQPLAPLPSGSIIEYKGPPPMPVILRQEAPRAVVGHLETIAQLRVIQPEDPAWVKWFKERYGWNENNPENDKQLSKGWQYTNVPYYSTCRGSVHAWCAMSLNTALIENGYQGTHDAGAISFGLYGKACGWVYGCIVVIEHASGGHHVTLFMGWKDEANKIGYFLGGNQDDQIYIAAYDVSGKPGADKAIALRWPVKA